MSYRKLMEKYATDLQQHVRFLSIDDGKYLSRRLSKRVPSETLFAIAQMRAESPLSYLRRNDTPPTPNGAL